MDKLITWPPIMPLDTIRRQQKIPKLQHFGVCFVSASLLSEKPKQYTKATAGLLFCKFSQFQGNFLFSVLCLNSNISMHALLLSKSSKQKRKLIFPIFVFTLSLVLNGLLLLLWMTSKPQFAYGIDNRQHTQVLDPYDGTELPSLEQMLSPKPNGRCVGHREVALEFSSGPLQKLPQK